MKKLIIKVPENIIDKLKGPKPKPKPTSQQLANRCALNSEDCDEAVDFLDELIQSKNLSEVERLALMYSAIISYGRAISRNRFGKNIADFAKADLGRATGNSADLIELHKLIKDRRNKLVAHSDEEHSGSILLSKKGTQTLRAYDKTWVFQGVDLNLFRDLANKMSIYFQRKQSQLDLTQDDIP